MIKVNYDPLTTLVKGYYPDSVNYSSIPEPFIEIEDSEQDNSKQMCVAGGVYQEYVKPLDVQLQEAKTAKLDELQTSLNAALVKPHDSDEAEEVTVDELLQETSTGNLFYFLFKTQGTGLPLTEPANLLSRIANNANPDYYLRYSCTIIDPAVAGGFRRGYVKITKALALSISDHMTIRGTSSITESNIIYSLIVAAATIEELNAIDITIS